MFGNWYMSKISMHQNIYHLYLILEKLAQKMEKKTKIHSSKSQSLQYQIFSDLSNPDLRILDLISFPDPVKIWDLILIPIPENGTQIPIFLDPDPKEQFIDFSVEIISFADNNILQLQVEIIFFKKEGVHEFY